MPIDQKANQVAATLVEFISKTLIERNYFQNYAITPSMLIFLANDLIKTLNQAQAEKFSLAKELSITYKQFLGKELTSEEKRYDAEGLHALDVMGEIYNGIKYATGFSVAKNLYHSIFSSASQGLSSHLPAVMGYTGLAYAGAYLISKTIDEILAATYLEENQKAVLRPWLNTVGRLAIGFIPKAHADANGITYQYPAKDGHTVRYLPSQIITQQGENLILEKLANREVNSPEGSYTADDIYHFKLHSVHSLTEHAVRILAINSEGKKVPVIFSLNNEKNFPELSIKSSDKLLEEKWQAYFINSGFIHKNKLLEETKSATTSSMVMPPSKNAPEVAKKPTSHSTPTYSGLQIACYFAVTQLIKQPSTLKSVAFVGKMLATLLCTSNYVSAYEKSKPQQLNHSAEKKVNPGKSVSHLQGNGLYSANGIKVVSLKGSHREMGRQYGLLLSSQLEEVLQILKDFYVEQHQLPYEKLVTKADLFYQRYSYSYQLFIQGIAETSGLSLDDCKVLNGMETLNSLLRHTTNSSSMGWCAFLSLPPEKTSFNGTLLGRNYDFPAPFDKCAKYLTVTILHENDKIPTAFIAMAGQIYCPSCLNAKGIFMELNNGTPSGGYIVDTQRQSLLVNLLHIMQNSENFQQTESQLRATQSDYSLIINTANSASTKSYEFSSSMGMKPNFPKLNETFASTNFFLNSTWQGVPEPMDNSTWLGVTRRNNLLKLASAKTQHTIEDFMQLMDKKIEEGGAVWDFTIYQMIFNPKNLTLYLKITQEQKDWTPINLAEFFKQDAEAKQDMRLTLGLLGAVASGSTIINMGLLFTLCLVCVKRLKNKQDNEKTPLTSGSTAVNYSI